LRPENKEPMMLKRSEIDPVVIEHIAGGVSDGLFERHRAKSGV